jgi:copper(I)-binding protein
MIIQHSLRSSLRGGLAACALAVAGCATSGAMSGAMSAGARAADPIAATVVLKTAWLRPAAAGMAEAQAYVDIVSETDLELVGASTPFAKQVELVQVTIENDLPEQKVVKSMPVPGGKTTRLAYRGSHLRLVEITTSFGNATNVPLTLAFKSPDGKDVTATIDAQVRGLLLPQQMPATLAKDPEPATKDAPPAGAK